MKIINKSKIFGVNLISLIIGSALGVFILSVIVKVSFTISNNYQIIKANTELAIAARVLNTFFTKAFSANGYIAYNPTVSSTKINNFFGINTKTNETKFDLWYSAGLGGALLCSGQTAIPIPDGSNLNPPLFIRLTLNTTPTADTQCNDSQLMGVNLPPIVSNKKFKNFHLVAIANNDPTNNTNNKVNNIAINNPNNTIITPAIMPSYGYTKGIKLAIILKSSKPVFNTSRNSSFKLFNNIDWTTNDKFLYKLIIIQSPFLYTALNKNNTTTIEKCDPETTPSCLIKSLK